MARAKGIPNYRLHKARGLAVVHINGKDFYLGKYNSKESLAAYDKLILEYRAKGQVTEPKKSDEMTVEQLAKRYEVYAEDYFNGLDRRRTKTGLKSDQKPD